MQRIRWNFHWALAVWVFIGAGLLPGRVAQGAVTFLLQFEADSKWFTESYGERARNSFQQMLDEIGQKFASTAEVRISVDDNETVAYARSGSQWSETIPLPGRAGRFNASSLWLIINRGSNRTATATSDAFISWNFDLDRLYAGSGDRLVNNVRGLVRHEILHPLGMQSFLSQQVGGTDPRAGFKSSTVYDGLLFDFADEPLFINYDSQRQRFLVNNYSLLPTWTTVNGGSGLYFSGINKLGNAVKMPLFSNPGIIDFPHVYGVSYSDVHVPWGEWIDVDYDFLRGLGYRLVGDGSNATVSLEPIGYYQRLFRMRLTGPLGKSVTLERSADFVTWTPVQGVIFTSAAMIVDVTETADNTGLFYRAVE